MKCSNTQAYGCKRSQFQVTEMQRSLKAMSKYLNTFTPHPSFNTYSGNKEYKNKQRNYETLAFINGVRLEE
jgi:hypothetical protein